MIAHDFLQSVPPPKPPAEKPSNLNVEMSMLEERSAGTTATAGGTGNKGGKRGKKGTGALTGLPEKLSAKQVKTDLENIFMAFSRSVVSFESRFSSEWYKIRNFCFDRGGYYVLQFAKAHF